MCVEVFLLVHDDGVVEFRAWMHLHHLTPGTEYSLTYHVNYYGIRQIQ